MIVMTLADAHQVGVAVGGMLIPVTGLILLTVGLVQRIRGPKQPQPPVYPPALGSRPPAPPAPSGFRPPLPGVPPPPWPHQPPPVPPGYPPHLQPIPPRPKPQGNGLIIAGAIILALSVLSAIGRVAQSSHSNDTPSSVPTPTTITFPSLPLPTTTPPG